MDIHFCDLCGVRVTDVDLRGGHGIRKQYDVICATCLELGHGKEWLASHQRGKAAISASQPVQPAAAALAANKSNKQSPMVTIARDRVQTLEEGDDSPAVTPQVLSADEPDDGTATSELVNEEVSDETQRQQANNQFAAAASSFSALASTSNKVDAAADVEEDAQQGEGLSDESTSAPILADPQAGDGSAGDAGESPFDFKDDHQSGSAQKDETLPGDREPLINDKAGEKKKSSSGSASFKKSGTNNKSSSANSKSGNNKASRSGKGPAKKVNKNKNILMMSALSLGILTMILLITVQALKKPRKEQQLIEVDLSENVKSAIKDAKFNATKALQPSGSLNDCLAARDQIQAIRPEISNFEKAATSQNPPWTDEQMGQYLENIGWADLNSFVITLNQKIARLKAPGGGN